MGRKESNQTNKQYKKVSEYDQEIPQSHTADQPTAGITIYVIFIISFYWYEVIQH